MLPDPPKLGRFRRYNFSSPRAYTFKISLYAPVKRPLFSIACEQALHLGDIVKSTRASGKRGETRQLRSSKWRACWQVMLSSINNDAAIWCLGTSQILVIALLASFFLHIFFDRWSLQWFFQSFAPWSSLWALLTPPKITTPVITSATMTTENVSTTVTLVETTAFLASGNVEIFIMHVPGNATLT